MLTTVFAREHTHLTRTSSTGGAISKHNAGDARDSDLPHTRAHSTNTGKIWLNFHTVGVNASICMERAHVIICWDGGRGGVVSKGPVQICLRIFLYCMLRECVYAGFPHLHMTAIHPLCGLFLGARHKLRARTPLSCVANK